MNDLINVIDRRRIAVYLIFAFGIAWTGALVIYLTGGLVNSPSVAGFTLAILVLTIVYMGAPALANVLTRLLTREGWHDLYLRPKLRQGWPYWIICWVAPPLLIFLGAAVFFVVFPAYYNPTLSTVRKMLEAAGDGQSLSQVDPWAVVISQTLVAILIAPLINAIPIFGEEFGWRAYLQPKLMPFGGRKAALLTGVIWGLWHAPVIAMGYNYGFEYPGAPWLGPLAMIWFTIVFGAVIGWAALRAGSVWPAVIGHGALNGMAGIVTFFVQGQPNTLLGPSVVCVIGSIGLAAVALILFLVPGALDPFNGRQIAGQPLIPAEPALDSLRVS
jgi:uncharacterized protein